MHSNKVTEWETMRAKLIGLGEDSFRKNYYPQLQEYLDELRLAHEELERVIVERTAALLRTNGALQTEIGERRRTELALRESEERYRRLVEMSPNGIIIREIGGIIYANPAVARLFEVDSPAELIGKKLGDFVSFDGQDEMQRLIEGAISAEETLVSVELKLILKNDKTKDVEVTVIPYANARQPVAQIVLHDITEQRQREVEQLRMDKLESLGLLAGGIAHDFKNILMVIMGNISMAKLYTQMGETAKITERLEDTEKASQRAKDLSQQLLTFAKGGEPIVKTASIVELIREIVGFTLRGSNVRCELVFSEMLWTVEIDEGQISQVLGNLIINADQAMPDGGIISITAENSVVSEADNLPLPDGNYVRISVTDQGGGIPHDCLSKIFDPY